MDKQDALDAANRYFENGTFLDDLARRVRFETESRDPDRMPKHKAYLRDEVSPALEVLSFSCQIWDNPIEGTPPFLFAERVEDPDAPTVLIYAHGDVVNGDKSHWSADLDPWTVRVEAGRIYGRGTADNKGQFTINLGALASTIASRNGALGYNVKILMEMAEEIGSVGLATIVEQQRETLAADLFIASDGPRFAADEPTLALGSRGFVTLSLKAYERERGYHSGNWGGLLRNPAITLSHAVSQLVDKNGCIQVTDLQVRDVPPALRECLAPFYPLWNDSGQVAIDTEWGQPELAPLERLYCSNTLELLAMDCCNGGIPPTNSIPGMATAYCHVRFVPGLEAAGICDSIEAHLHRNGFESIQVEMRESMQASRLDPGHPAVDFIRTSIERSLGRRPLVLPNIGGSIPNAIFAEKLDVPTIWVPHSYSACGQHGPDEHLLESNARSGLTLMAGLWWDLGEPDCDVWASR